MGYYSSILVILGQFIVILGHFRPILGKYWVFFIIFQIYAFLSIPPIPTHAMVQKSQIGFLPILFRFLVG